MKENIMRFFFMLQHASSEYCSITDVNQAVRMPWKVWCCIDIGTFNLYYECFSSEIKGKEGALKKDN